VQFYRSSLLICWCNPVKTKRGGSVSRSLTTLSTTHVETGEHDERDNGVGRPKGKSGATMCAGKNRKGCDIGYAPATNSCERASSVDTCTIAALDAITAFAVPDPNCSSQNQSVFSGLVALQVAPQSRSLSLLRIGKFYLANPFSRRREPN